MVFNQNQGNSSVVPDANGNVEINGTTYNMSTFGGSISGTTKVAPLAPYAGIGIGGNPDKRFADGHLFFDFNLGVLYEGGTTTTLAAANGGETEQVNALSANIDNFMDSYKFLPVVSVNLYYFF